MAFADFMTAMMAFFLVMWISGLNTTIKSAVAAYFQDPVAFNEAVAKGNAPFAITESTVGGPLSNPGGDPGQAPVVQVTTDTKQLDSIKSKIEKLISDTPEFKDLKDFVDVKLTSEGLQIELLEVRQSLFFDSGSSHIKPKTRILLMKIGKELSKVKNKMVVEGHTDSLPLRRSDGYTNWELSTDRANGARRVLETTAIKHGQIVQVRGLADNKLRDSIHPESFTNRRVSIILLYDKTQSAAPEQIKEGFSNHPKVDSIDPADIDKPKASQETHETSELVKPSEKKGHKAEQNSESAYSVPPVNTGTGNHDITVVSREGKVFTVPAGDLMEGIIPKIKP